jgi:hypothetical protein
LASVILESKDSAASSLDTVSQNAELKVNPEQYAEVHRISGIYNVPEVISMEQLHEYPLTDGVIEVREEAVPAYDMIEEKANRTMDKESTNAETNSDDAPAATFSTGPTITSTSTQLNNVASPQWTTGGAVPTTTIVADSVKVQPKKKKKTPPKKK